jgi:hypothetical protein
MPLGRPPFRKITIIGHQFVNADWNRFTPTNNVNQRKLTFTYIPRSTLNTTKAPAINRSARSTVMTNSSRTLNNRVREHTRPVTTAS